MEQKSIQDNLIAGVFEHKLVVLAGFEEYFKRQLVCVTHIRFNED